MKLLLVIYIKLKLINRIIIFLQKHEDSCFHQILLKYCDYPLLKKIIKYAKKNDILLTIRLCKEIHNRYPNKSLILYYLSEMLLNLRLDTSLPYIKLLIKKNPRKFIGYIFFAEYLIQKNQYQSALKIYDYIIAKTKYPKNIDIKKAKLYINIGEYDKAEEILNKYEPIVRNIISELNNRKRIFKKYENEYYNINIGGYSNIETDNYIRRLDYYYKNIPYLKHNKLINKYKMDFRKISSIRKKYLQKLWRKENIKDKTVLVYCYQGYGDNIMFCRYLYILEKITKKIIVQIHSKQIRLMQYNFPNIKFIPLSEEINDKDFDFATSIKNLIYNLDLDLNNIPYTNKYLNIEEIEQKDFIIKQDNSKLNILFFISGNFLINENRKIPIENFAEILKLPFCNFYSFNISNKSEINPYNNLFHDLSQNIKDFYDTAMILNQIDILITIDTAIVHLGGALGINTFLMLPYSANWRWFDDTNTSSWYNSVKIFKQNKLSCWDNVISNIIKDLNNAYMLKTSKNIS